MGSFRSCEAVLPILQGFYDCSWCCCLRTQVPLTSLVTDFFFIFFSSIFLNHAFQWSTWNTSKAGYTTRSHTLVLLHYLCETSLWDIFMRLPASVALSDLVGMLWILKPNQFFFFFFANTLNSIARHKGSAKTSVFENKTRSSAECNCLALCFSYWPTDLPFIQSNSQSLHIVRVLRWWCDS